MCIIDGDVSCITNPISNAINNFFLPFIGWIWSSFVSVLQFISDIGSALSAVTSLVTGVFSSIFASNSYATITFGLIMSAIGLIVALRIYNIFAGTTIFGWKLPRI